MKAKKIMCLNKNGSISQYTEYDLYTKNLKFNNYSLILIPIDNHQKDVDVYFPIRGCDFPQKISYSEITFGFSVINISPDENYSWIENTPVSTIKVRGVIELYNFIYHILGINYMNKLNEYEYREEFIAGDVSYLEFTIHYNSGQVVHQKFDFEEDRAQRAVLNLSSLIPALKSNFKCASQSIANDKSENIRINKNKSMWGYKMPNPFYNLVKMYRVGLIAMVPEPEFKIIDQIHYKASFSILSAYNDVNLPKDAYLLSFNDLEDSYATIFESSSLSYNSDTNDMIEILLMSYTMNSLFQTYASVLEFTETISQLVFLDDDCDKNMNVVTNFIDVYCYPLLQITNKGFNFRVHGDYTHAYSNFVFELLYYINNGENSIDYQGII